MEQVNPKRTLLLAAAVCLVAIIIGLVMPFAFGDPAGSMSLVGKQEKPDFCKKIGKNPHTPVSGYKGRSFDLHVAFSAIFSEISNA